MPRVHPSAFGSPPSAPTSSRRGFIRRGRALTTSVLPLCWALIALGMFSVGRVQELFPPLMALRPALLATGFSLLYVVLNPDLLSSIPALRPWPSRVVIALLVWAVVGAPFGLNPNWAIMFVISSWSTILMAWLLQVIAIRSTRELRLLIGGFLVAAGVLAINAVFFTKMTFQEGSTMARLDDASGSMFDPNDLCVLLVTAMPLAMSFFHSSKRLGKILSVGFIMLCSWTVALSGSRGGFLGLLVVGLALLYLAKGMSVSKRVGIVFGLVAVLVVAAPAGYWEQMETIVKPGNDYNVSSEHGRKAIWLRGMHYMATYPIFGLGIANFNNAECTISPLVLRPDLSENAEAALCTAPHNSFVQVAAEMGVPGLFMWSSLVIGGVIAPVRLRRRMPKRWQVGDREQRYLYRMTMYLPVAAMGYGVTAFFVSHAWLDMVYSLAAFTAGLYVAVNRRLWQERMEPEQPVHAVQQVAVPVRGRRLLRGRTA